MACDYVWSGKNADGSPAVGGYFTLQVLTRDYYDAAVKSDGSKATPIAGLGDAAEVTGGIPIMKKGALAASVINSSSTSTLGIAMLMRVALQLK